MAYIPASTQLHFVVFWEIGFNLQRQFIHIHRESFKNADTECIPMNTFLHICPKGDNGWLTYFKPEFFSILDTIQKTVFLISPIWLFVFQLLVSPPFSVGKCFMLEFICSFKGVRKKDTLAESPHWTAYAHICYTYVTKPEIKQSMCGGKWSLPDWEWSDCLMSWLHFEVGNSEVNHDG